ncbi:uridine-cytidine kinase-like protein [Sarcoptes scabiei]|uniref:Uridine kinase n=1 Tax=Sarcoptes scabiei TaxID=52283 RepID=A0A132ALA4_SARSC|nr:uridine-cytidine kinase-like protein [Sarcoptes scabiei]
MNKELILNRSIIEIDNELPPDLLLTHRPYSPILFANSFENECDSIFRGQWKFQKNFTTFHKHFKTDRVLRTSKRTIYTAGRPPWFDAQGQSKESFLIGICGGSASGKTTVAKKIIEALDIPWVTLLSMDCFYKVLDQEQQEMARRNEFNFDHPDAFDFELLIETLRKLKEGKRVDVPTYNFVTHSREKMTKTMYGASVIICEGILIFAKKELVDMMDMKVFIETDSDIRLARRLQRDITERGRDLEGVVKQYNQFVKPMFDFYIQPSMVHADIIVPRGGENRVAIDLIVQHVHTQLQSKGLKIRSKLIKLNQNMPLPSSLKILPLTPQIRGMHTIIREKYCSRDEFIFYSRRLMRLLLEFTLSFCPFEPVQVQTQQDIEYAGKMMSCDNICGISILQAGETMEHALCDVLKTVQIGKILIKTNQMTQEPELYYLRLPDDIKDMRVILMDATVASGAAAMMAIRVLLDHDVPEEHIFLSSMIMAMTGIQTIAYAFPKVLMMTTEVDPEVNTKYYIRPGIGNYGDRYYGTDDYD